MLYRSRKGGVIEIEDVPSKENIEDYWGSIWNQDGDYGPEAFWLNDVQKTYCENASQKTHKITKEILDKAISKVQNNKSPGPDEIIGFWYKNLHFYRNYLVKLFQQILNGSDSFPSEIILAQTTLIPKNKDT